MEYEFLDRFHIFTLTDGHLWLICFNRPFFCQMLPIQALLYSFWFHVVWMMTMVDIPPRALCLAALVIVASQTFFCHAHWLKNTTFAEGGGGFTAHISMQKRHVHFSNDLRTRASPSVRSTVLLFYRQPASSVDRANGGFLKMLDRSTPAAGTPPSTCLFCRRRTTRFFR